MLVILYPQIRLSWATLLVNHVGGFKFQETHPNMVRLGLLSVEDDILYNKTTIDSMLKSSKGIPFKEGQEIHVSTLGPLIQTCSSKGSLVVGMNSFTGSLSDFLSNLVFNFIFSTISHSYHYRLSLQGIIFVLVNLLVVMFLFLNQTMMFMKRWSSPFWRKLDLR